MYLIEALYTLNSPSVAFKLRAFRDLDDPDFEDIADIPVTPKPAKE